MILNLLQQKKKYLEKLIVFLKSDIDELQNDEFNSDAIDTINNIIDYTLFELKTINTKIKIIQNLKK